MRRFGSGHFEVGPLVIVWFHGRIAISFVTERFEILVHMAVW
jgi:hypothetical protein